MLLCEAQQDLKIGQLDNNKDLLAWRVMSGDEPDVRKAKQKLGGTIFISCCAKHSRIGGVKAQETHRRNKTNRFNSETQRARGKKGAAVNKAQGTGAWDPENLKKANEAIRANPEEHAALRSNAGY